MEEENFNQVACCGCGSYRMGLIGLETLKDGTEVHILCNDCGLLQKFNVGGKNNKPTPTKKKEEGDYYG